jgi:hypothetical protein
MFWMVLGKDVPTWRHDSLNAARTEAARLAKQNPGHAFTVLESVATCKAEGVSWVELRVDAEPDEFFPGWFLLGDGDLFVKGDRIRLSRETHDDPTLWSEVPEGWYGKNVNKAIAARSFRPF